MPHTFAKLPFTPRFTLLHSDFATPTEPTSLPKPYLIAWNESFATQIGLSEVHNQPELAEYLVGNHLPEGIPSYSSVYSGHQFGVRVPRLGDGRALLIAEYQDPQNNIWEIQLKGAGKTPYSRRGDGRAVLRSSIREYLCSEAMFGLNIPTTRALALAGSDQVVWREGAESAAVLTRLAPTFVRFGHFEYFFHHAKHDRVKELTDWVIAHFYPECLNAENPILAFLKAVASRTSSLIAKWQAVGFCHGVMNSDNMSILGLTLDYGPFGFMDSFDAHHICNESDDRGRYAYNQQVQVGLWNLHYLTEAFSHLLPQSQLVEVLNHYQDQFEIDFTTEMGKKLGITQWQESDWPLATELFDFLQNAHTDWTIFWRTLSHWQTEKQDEKLLDLIIDRAGFANWLLKYQQRLETDQISAEIRQQHMLLVNPKYVLRNHLAQQAITLAEKQHDFSEIERLHHCLSQPFAEQPEYEAYAKAPPEGLERTGISCSS